MSTSKSSIGPGQLAHEAVPAFVMGGRAVLTVKGHKDRFTFKVTAPKRDQTGAAQAPETAQVRFVAVLTGQDNQGDYSFLGTILPDGTFVHGRKSPIASTAPSAKAAAWFFNRLGNLPEALEVYHQGQCCRCGRALTVPESISSGIGPECGRKREAAKQPTLV